MPLAVQSDAGHQPPRRRTRTGCVNCSRRRRKCDESKPNCIGCRRRGEKCQWRQAGCFREANIKVLEPEHPSMNQSSGVRTRRPSKFKILNVAPSSSPKKEGPKDDETTQPDQACSFQSQSDDISHQSPPTPQSNDNNRFTTSNDPPGEYLHSSSPEFMVDDLAALRNLSGNPTPFPQTTAASEPYQAITSPLFDHSVFSDPENFTNDVFLPGSAYEALHTALRNRQLWTARSDVPSRPNSPVFLPGQVVGGISEEHMPCRDNRQSRRRLFQLSPERENVLWQNYLNEICVWLDMFDKNRHFASTFTQMAKSEPHLRYSILALSARQIERKQHEKSQSESLSLYQEAIHLLLPELESKTTPVIASCVILCVLEMLSCNPKEWRRHLDGCAYLLQAAEITGFSGKEEQALFWCFARMDVCGGLISEEETIIPMENWIPKDMSPIEAYLFFTSDVGTFDTYANYTVYLCAHTVGLLFGPTSQMPSCMPGSRYIGSSPDDHDSYVNRWKRLFESVDQWYESRPCQMKQIFTIPAGKERPFPTILYGNGAAISGNQLYHTCALLLLQRKPKTLSLSKRPKSVLWHARQICSISASNAHHGCWTNALQPLWIAGKVMSHHSEHAAIVETLTRIERETGWATAWRVEDLKDFWGDGEEDVEMDGAMGGGDFRMSGRSSVSIAGE